MSQEVTPDKGPPFSFFAYGVVPTAYRRGGMRPDSIHTLIRNGVETRGPKTGGKRCWRKRGKRRSG